MKWLQLTVAHKLWCLVGGLLFGMLALVAGSLMYSSHITEGVLAQVVRAQTAAAQAKEWRLLTQMSIDRFTAAAMSTEENLVEHQFKLMAQLIKDINHLREQVELHATSDEAKRLLGEVSVHRNKLFTVNKTVDEARRSREFDRSMQIINQELNPVALQYYSALDAYVQLQDRYKADAVTAGESARQSAMWVIWSGCLFTIALGLVTAIIIMRSITQPLQKAVDLANTIAAGDLTASVPEARQDELGVLLQALNTMAHKLRAVVHEVRSGVASVSVASEEIASGNQNLSARTEQTAANLQQTAASMEQLTATVEHSAETARRANQLASSAAQAAQQGGTIVAQVVNSMTLITDSSNKIADIIGVIDSIAFQTNILALNAAVEAARAGEQGRGFAVVASEVRALAQRSAAAAKEIKQLISTSVDNVQSGSQQVEQAGRSMHEIVSSVHKVSEMIGEITASSSEQRDGIHQINQAVGTLDHMTQQNATLVEKSSTATIALKEQALQLSHVVSAFQIDAANHAQRLAAPATHRQPLALT